MAIEQLILDLHKKPFRCKDGKMRIVSRHDSTLAIANAVKAAIIVTEILVALDTEILYAIEVVGL